MKKSLLILIIVLLISVSIFVIFKNIFREKEATVLNNNQTKNIVLIKQDKNDSNDIAYPSPMYNKKEEIMKKYSGYIGRQITLEGKVSMFWNQTSGSIKFCIIDDNHKEVDVYKDCDWFWAAFEDEDDLRTITKVLEKYTGIKEDNIDLENDVYLVSGVLTGLDCDYAIGERCFPDVSIEKIIKVN